LSRPAAGVLFVGLCTLDVIQLVDHVPARDEKTVALRQTIAAGGPATNAAVTCSYLGGAATLLTGVGAHPLAAGIRADLAPHGVTILDLHQDHAEPPTVSSIMVTESTGERAVVSTNAVGHDLRPPDNLDALVADATVVELDGHHISLARAVATQAAAAGRVTLFDGGSWKPGTADLLPYLDVVVCSAGFRPPDVSDVLRFLLDSGVSFAAVTSGPGPIRWQTTDDSGTFAVPAGIIADTLGAGDVLHGALAYALHQNPALTTDVFVSALTFAAGIATRSCASFGTRGWMRR
jgi:sugar/nucleoside kinase (ribokinase family)